MKIEEFIDSVGIKYGYNQELIQALKRCIPAMIEGKTEEEISLLIQTLERVQIYTFEKQPSREETDAIKQRKLNGRNKHVTEVSYDMGEYGEGDVPGAYVSEPIFDENMNIIDRVGYIYITNLPEKSKTAKFYGTTINLSHLIHELGHAWASQKGEFKQEESGDYTMNIGAIVFHNKVDRGAHTIETVEIEGLYVEEALNSIEEEEALYRLLQVDNFHDIPEYIPSNYQGTMTDMMRRYTEKLGKNIFEKMRFQKDRTEIEQLQEVFDETDFMKSMQEPDYYIKKAEQLESAQHTSMSDRAKKKIADFFEKYREVYLMPHKRNSFLGHLDNVMEQVYNFNSVRYSYDILHEDIMQAYSKTQIAIFTEGYRPVNQVAKILEQQREQESGQITSSDLARATLEGNVSKRDIGLAKRTFEESKEDRDR